MKSLWHGLSIAALLGMVVGCGNIGEPSTYPMATPIQPRFEYQAALFQLDQILYDSALHDDERANFLYEQGKLYDKLGMYVLAQSAFSQSLEIKPNNTEIFSYLGGYLTLQGDFDSANEAYESSLELDPNNMFARFNRSIALYYGVRNTLAWHDLLSIYHHDVNNPFIVLWLFLVEDKLDSRKAKAMIFQRHAEARNRTNWGWKLVDFYLGHIGEKELLQYLQKSALDNVMLAEYLSETYFYLGKYYTNKGKRGKAKMLFKLSTANNVFGSMGHRYSLLELAVG